jgi:hypothetical protein
MFHVEGVVMAMNSIVVLLVILLVTGRITYSAMPWAMVRFTTMHKTMRSAVLCFSSDPTIYM